MAKPFIIAGLDIGSSKVASVAAEVSKNQDLAILAQSTVNSRGVSRGAVNDLTGAASSVSEALSKLCEKISARPSEVYMNVTGLTIKGARSKGMTPLSLRGREVNRSDIKRCVEAASTINLPYDREIIQRVVRNFSIDDQMPVKDPMGLFASRLNCEVYIITADSNHIQNIYKCVNMAGYDVKEAVFTGTADGYAMIGKEENEGQVVILDMGQSLAQAFFFSDGQLSDLEIMPMGDGDFKGDYAQNQEFGKAIDRMAAKIRDFAGMTGKVRSILLTGGMAFSDGMAEFLEARLSAPVKVGVAKDIKGSISSVDSARLATAIGLVKYASGKSSKKEAERKGLIGNLSSKVVDILNNYF